MNIQLQTKPMGSISRVIALIAVLSVSACGGSGSAPTTPVSTQVPEVVQGAPMIVGTVDGFGSLIVDGKRIDNHGVTAQVEKENGNLTNVEVKLGHKVEVQHDGNGVAKQVRVRSTVEGIVQSVDVTAGSLKVMGQTVVVNSDAAKGPVTVFEQPYTQLADVKVNDNVEVHALIKQEAADKMVMQATRIAKRDADSHDRVHGIVSALSTTAHTFKLGDLLIDYTDAKISPEKAVLENGIEVQVFIAANTVSTSQTAKAKYVIVLARKPETEGKPVEVGGAISVLDTAGKKMTVNGVSIDISAATFNQPGKTMADLKLGMYVIVKGVYVTNTGLKASTIVIRGVDGEKDKIVELHGTILDFLSNASFTVRGVKVDASAATIDAVSCKGTTLANHMQVEIKGALQANGSVKASAVKCEDVKETSSVIGRNGVASKVDATAKSFTLTTEKETLTVKWNEKTVFVRASADALDGKKLSVEGLMTNGVLLAEKIVLAQK
ncbi:MAG: hypothetical protein HY253_13350 [Burkholderiales bacterium]|nr:hypothetical protein [Burkholderiales bacterium]